MFRTALLSIRSHSQSSSFADIHCTPDALIAHSHPLIHSQTRRNPAPFAILSVSPSAVIRRRADIRLHRILSVSVVTSLQLVTSLEPQTHRNSTQSAFYTLIATPSSSSHSLAASHSHLRFVSRHPSRGFSIYSQIMIILYPALTRRAVSSTDGPGGIYVYEIPPYQPNCPNRRRRRALARREVKIGHAIDPPKRRKQWLRKCRGQRQSWWFYWDVPFAKKFETIMHEHFKRAGAWIRPEECDWCTVNHREKFDYEKCGGRRGIIQVAEGYLGLLGWPVIRRAKNA
ncbi:hypothetical protein B0H17DRAFT_1209654 [Mycena rosella]|uniref:Bacteriophage T5 Orf172 DNA-binding domain-containing protein n=1 Tax=Mycena rosella TaxID=1033263 RepID=A0AAD7CXT4_MYCRO|nr:hypothetical protein B0H17DRAFT_1209654 [Mycena rosella]